MLVGLSSWQGLRDGTTQHGACGNTQQQTQTLVTAPQKPGRQNASYLLRTKTGESDSSPAASSPGSLGPHQRQLWSCFRLLGCPQHAHANTCAPAACPPPAKEASDIWGERQQTEHNYRCPPWTRPASGLGERPQQLQSRLLPLCMHQAS